MRGLPLFHHGLFEEMGEGVGQYAFHMAEPQQGAYTLAGGEGHFLHRPALAIYGIPIAGCTPMAVFVEPLGHIVDECDVAGLDKYLVK